MIEGFKATGLLAEIERVEDRKRDRRYYDNELVESGDFIELTATILKARYYAQHPEGIEVEGKKLDFIEAIESGGDNIVEAVWAEWATMTPADLDAQYALLAAIERLNWNDEDWETYRQQQKAKQDRQQAAKARMKLEAAQRQI